MAGARLVRKQGKARASHAARRVLRATRSHANAASGLRFKSPSSPLLVVDRHGVITDLNAAAARLCAWTLKSLRGRPLNEILLPDANAASKPTAGKRWNLTSAGSSNRPQRGWLARRTGQPIPVVLRLLGVSGPDAPASETLLLIERAKAAPTARPAATALAGLLRQDRPFREAFDRSSIGIALLDSSGSFLRVNEALCKLTGHTRTQLLRKSLDSMTHPDDRNPGASGGSQRTERLASKHWDKKYLHKDGRSVWLRVSMTTLSNGKDKAPYFLTGFQDITALKTATGSLRESEERFRSAFEASAIGMGLVSLEGTYLRVNRALCQFFGLEGDALIGHDIAEFNEPSDYATIVERRRQMIEGRIPRFFSYEKRFLHRSGRPLWGQLTVALVRDPEDQPSYFVILIQDTTERHNAESTLRESEQRLRALVEGLPVLMDAFGENGEIVAWNKECEQVTGYSAEEIIGNPRAMELLYPDPDYRAAMMEDAQKHASLPYRNRAWDLRTKSGKIRTVAWSNVGAAVQIPGWTEWGIGIDITERRRLELALQQASEYEQRRLGQEMHDGLGQELAALALLAYSLASKPDLKDELLRQELERLAQIARQAVRSGRAIAHGLAPLNESDGDMIEALRRMTQHHLAEVSGTQVVLEEDLRAELAIPETARSHIYRIAQEALNNAIRHAKATSVRMELKVTPRMVRLTIRDDGKGFTARAERSVGMGLKTMQNRATAIGASLTIKTEPEAGTSITVECLNLNSTADHLVGLAVGRSGKSAPS